MPKRDYPQRAEILSLFDDTIRGMEVLAVRPSRTLAFFLTLSLMLSPLFVVAQEGRVPPEASDSSSEAAAAEEDVSPAALDDDQDAEPLPPDVTPPTIMDIVIEVNGSGVSIRWNTDEITTGQVLYGLEHPYDQETSRTTTLDMAHGVRITGLADGDYHGRIRAEDGSGNVSFSSDIHFVIGSAGGGDPRPDPDVDGGEGGEGGGSESADTEPPVISELTAGRITSSSAVIAWLTNEAADSSVIYGLTSEYGSTTLRNNTYALTHEFMLSGLLPDTTYHFSAVSRDAAGNLTLSVDNTFRTLPESGVGTEPPEGGNTGEPGGPESGDSSAGTGSIPSSGPHGGGSIDILPPGQPERVRASGLDRTILLSWAHPADGDFSHVRVVRSATNYPAAPTDGALVYEGDGRIFSDTGLENGKTYYYSLFAADGISNYAPPVQLSIAPQAGVTQYHVATAESEAVRMLTTDTYGQGREGQEVAYLQRLLATNPQLYPEGLVTGYFGPLTEAALKRFQEKYDIPQTGMVDGDTRAIARTLSVPRVEASPLSALDMQLGDRGDTVRVLQTALVRFGYLAPEAVTGYFGELTRAAVISFQRDRGIEPAAGYVGPKTRAAGVLELSGN